MRANTMLPVRRNIAENTVPATPTLFDQAELALRWRISSRTLEAWRHKNTGPNYTKIGSRVFYMLVDIEAYERRRRAETHPSVLGDWR